MVGVVVGVGVGVGGCRRGAYPCPFALLSLALRLRLSWLLRETAWALVLLPWWVLSICDRHRVRCELVRNGERCLLLATTGLHHIAAMLSAAFMHEDADQFGDLIPRSAISLHLPHLYGLRGVEVGAGDTGVWESFIFSHL